MSSVPPACVSDNAACNDYESLVSAIDLLQPDSFLKGSILRFIRSTDIKQSPALTCLHVCYQITGISAVVIHNYMMTAWLLTCEPVCDCQQAAGLCSGLQMYKMLINWSCLKCEY